MSVRLIAEHPCQPADVHFDYLDVFEVARAILGNPDSETESEDSLDEPHGMRNRCSECTQEPRYDREERESWGADYIYRTCEQWRSPPLVDHDPHHRRSDNHHTPPPAIETKVVCLKGPPQEEEGHDANDLVRQMEGLSVNDEAYAMLYTWCALRFPNVARLLPKPPLFQPVPAPVPTASFSLQGPTPVPQPVPPT